MNVTPDPNSQDFMDTPIAQGRDRTPTEAVTDGLHLLAQREAQFQERKQSLIAAMESDEEVSEAVIDQALAKVADDLRRRGLAE
jgi:hypothetical protein